MILTLQAYTIFHVVISLIAIIAGLIVLHGWLTARRLDGWTLIFLLFTLATSVTGFFFPFNGFTPAIGTGILSVVVLLAAFAALYAFHLEGSWRWIYLVSAAIALYLNVFVLIIQAFLKIPALHALAPNGNEPPFAIVQGIVLVLFVIGGFLAVRRYRPVAG
ncbi:hypothetical protein [Mesorhizobium koreense]|uniref:hypothetical protein n=1 Tax=Mesorhizobium koreense TaxID=3074855 RepID=UPI00287B8C54|nr:hypothetical protein [Mesorhizobium sp. WR6]